MYQKLTISCLLFLFSSLFLSVSFSRHYFSLLTVSNPGGQFYMFSVIAAWLITLCGRPFETPQEYDDPNAIVSSILTHLRGLVSYNNTRTNVWLYVWESKKNKKLYKISEAYTPVMTCLFGVGWAGWLPSI